MPLGCCQAGAEGRQLVVLALLGDLVLADQTASVAHRRGERVLLLVGDRPALALPRQVSQRGAVPAVLNRRDPNCARAAVVSEGANSRIDPGNRWLSSRSQA
jgi:hypothetical protein